MKEVECFIGSYDDTKLDFDKNVRQYFKDGIIPDLLKTVSYKVYRVKQTGLAVHWSIAFSENDKRAFTIELGLSAYKGGKRAVLVCNRFDTSALKQHEYIGNIVSTASDIMNKSWDTFQHFGKYGIFNSCQEFANKLLSEMGMDGKQKMTAGGIGKAGIMGVIGVGILGVLVAGLSMIAGSGKDDDDDD